MRAYCQQEADRCSRRMREAAINDDADALFEQLANQRERWLKKKQRFMENDVPSTESSKVAGKVQQKKLLKDIVHVPSFKKDIPPLQIKGETKKKDRHNKRFPLFASVEDFFEEFESYLKSSEVPVGEYWKQCIFFTCAPEKRSWLESIIQELNDVTYESFKKELKSVLSSPYADLYHLMHVRYMQQKKMNLSLRHFALALLRYAHRHGIADDRSLLMDFVCNMEERYRKPTWDAIMRYNAEHGHFPSMSEMVKFAGVVEDVNMMSKVTDQSKPWSELMDDDDHSDSDDSESSDDEKLSKKRKRHSKHKGKKHAKAHHGKGKERAKPDLFCRLHKYGDHITDNCPDVLRMANQKHPKHQVGSNILKNPCRFCKRSEYFQGHSCKEMRDHNAKQDVGKKEEHKRMSARFAQLKYLGEDHHELDDDELMNSSSKQCKDNIWARAVQKEKTDQCLLLPITVVPRLNSTTKGCRKSLKDVRG